MRLIRLGYLAAALLALAPKGVQSQAPTLTGRLAAPPQPQGRKAGAGGFPSNSPYFAVGAQGFFKLDGTGDKEFLVSGQTVVDQLKLGKKNNFHVPFVANFSSLGVEDDDGIEGEISKLLTSSQGISLAVQPYYETAPSSQTLRATVYGSLGWKMNQGNSLADTSVTLKLHQGRVSAGIAVDIPLVNASTPLSLSFEPVYRFFSRERYKELFGEDRRSFLSLELTGVLPAGHVGLLAQGVLTDGAPSAWRIGFILAGGASSGGSGGGPLDRGGEQRAPAPPPPVGSGTGADSTATPTPAPADSTSKQK